MKTQKVTTLFNDTLVNHVQEEYYNKFLSGVEFENILTIEFTQKEDTNIFVISYDMNLYALINNPPLMYAKANNVDVAIKNDLVKFLEAPIKYKEQKLQEHFPTQFKIYKEQGEVPPPTTFRNEEWILKFKGNRFVSKEIIK